MAKMRDGAQWLSNHYAANDYYCEGEHVVGSRVGKGAEVFGIAGQQIEPQNEALLRLFSGQTPEGKKLKPHDSEIIGYDFQCSDGRFVVREAGEKLRILNEDHQGATPPEKNIAGSTATQQEARVDSGEAEQEPGWALSSGDLQKEQKPVPQPEKHPRSRWDVRIGKNGVIEHFRTEDGRVALRETGDEIHILEQDHDSMALALERALERFGTYLHFDGNDGGARTIVDILVTHDLRVTFTDDRSLSKLTTAWSRPRKTAKDTRDPLFCWSPRGMLRSLSSNARNWQPI